MIIDFAPIVNQVIVPLATPVLLAGFGWVAVKVATLFHLHIQAAQRVFLNTVIANGIAYGTAKLAALPETVIIDDKNVLMGHVADYATKTAPALLKSLGLDKDSAALAAVITARIPA